jgi:shikimate kinase
MGAEPGAHLSGGSKAKTIALIGPSGAGKTTLGRRLAEELGRPFIDTDELVVKNDGRAISQIFAEESERAFRKLERAAVEEAAGTPGAVIACGGGVVLSARNVDALKASGILIYLAVPPATAVARVGSGAGRPLVEGPDAEARLIELIRNREPTYLAVTDEVVETGGSMPEALAALKAVVAQVSA